MSAWVVEKTHIDVLLAFGLSDPSDPPHWLKDDGKPWSGENVGRLTYQTATAVGKTLIEENVASVCALYEGDTADEYAGALGYTFTDPHYVMSPGELLRAVSCLEYQSCEHDGWESSEARRILEALRAKACAKLSEGPWGWTPADLEGKPKQISLYGMMQGN